MKVDLHVHSTDSDGFYTQEQLVKLAKDNSISEMAITDHDVIPNKNQLENLERQYKIKLVPSIECATTIRGLHLLGYGIKDFDPLRQFIEKQAKYNEQQNYKTIYALQNDGVQISPDKILEVVNKKNISYKDIAKFLVLMGYANSIKDAYSRFIGRGTRAYFPSFIPKPNDVMNVLNNAGSTVSLAHPNTIGPKESVRDLVYYLTNKKLRCIECYNYKNGLLNVDYVKSLAKEFDLICTFGSDFHGEDGDVIGVSVHDEEMLKFNEIIM